MSDGDNAGPGHARGSDGYNTNQWITRKPRPPHRAAPWERSGNSESRPTSGPTNGRGNHTDGVSVAELIAKLSGTAPPPRRAERPHRYDERPTSHHRVDDAADIAIDDASWRDAVTEQIPVVQLPDMPDLTTAARRRRAEALLSGATTVVPAVEEPT